MDGAKAAGLQVGVYIFSQAITVAEAEEEADYIIDMVQGYDIDLPLVFDLEHYAGGRFSNAGLSARTITDMCLAFCARIEAAGYDSMVYSNPMTLYNDIYEEELGRLWLAHYTFETTYTEHEYEYWQCTSSGIIPGIDGRVDMDFWFRPNHPENKPSKPVATLKPAEVQSPAASPAADESPFQDVKPADWFYDAVLEAYEKGIVKGVSETEFQPGSLATRGQVVTMLYRLAGSPGTASEPAFAGLTYDYYKEAVGWAAENGYVTGVSEVKFEPERSITRQELVTILYRMAGQPASSLSLDEYKDAGQIQSWAKSALVWAVEKKIVTGYEDLTLKPERSATRAEVCALLMRYADGT